MYFRLLSSKFSAGDYSLELAFYSGVAVPIIVLVTITASQSEDFKT